jgi:hypothetical protein
MLLHSYLMDAPDPNSWPPDYSSNDWMRSADEFLDGDERIPFDGSADGIRLVGIKRPMKNERGLSLPTDPLNGNRIHKMNYRAASRAVSKIATPKNGAASCGVFIIPRKRDKPELGIRPPVRGIRFTEPNRLPRTVLQRRQL